MSNVIEVNEADFKALVLDSKIPVLVDFWAPWCGPCRVQGPILDELAPELAGKIIIAKVNVDENINLSTQYNIMSIPNLKLFKDGELVEDLPGVHDKSQLMQILEKYTA